MKFFLAGLIMLVVIGGGVFFFWPSSDEGAASSGSFWDVVKDPSSMPDLERIHSDLDDAAEKIAGDQKKIARMVDAYVFQTSGEGWGQGQTLARLGKEAQVRAVEILKDKSNSDRLNALKRPDENSLGAAPINRLLQLFDSSEKSPPEMIPLLMPFLDSEHDEVRKEVALCICAIGSVEILPALKKALKDEDEYVRSYSLMGIDWAIEGSRIDTEAREGIFDIVAGIWPEDIAFNVRDHVPGILLHLDRERATGFLLSDKIFHPGFDGLPDILEALRETEVEPPREKILAFIHEIGNRELKYPLEYILSESLATLGIYRNPDDLAPLEAYLDHEDETVVRGAVDGLYRYHDFFETIRDPWEVSEEHGWDALTEVEQHLCAVEMLDAEVNNGGFAQYYFNSSSENWIEARDGLKAAGSTELLGIFQKTLDQFPEGKPSTDRDERSDQLSEIAKRKEDPFGEQDSNWYDAKEKLDALLLRYNLKNREGREKNPERGE